MSSQVLWHLPFVILVPLLSLATMGPCLLGGPNLSGTWKLNRSVSKLGRLADSGVLFGPRELTQTIHHEGTNLRISLFQRGEPGEIRAELTYVSDGSERLNQLADTEVKSTVHWNKEVLMISSELQTYNIQMEDSWVLSPDGRTLTIERRITEPSSGGTEHQTLVLEKQE